MKWKITREYVEGDWTVPSYARWWWIARKDDYFYRAYSFEVLVRELAAVMQA